jgi:hypothetical protein
MAVDERPIVPTVPIRPEGSDYKPRPKDPDTSAHFEDGNDRHLSITPGDDRVIARGSTDQSEYDWPTTHGWRPIRGEERAEYPRSGCCPAVIGECLHELIDKLAAAAWLMDGRQVHYNAAPMEQLRRRIPAEHPQQTARLCACGRGEEVTSSDPRAIYAGEHGSPEWEACRKRHQRAQARQKREARDARKAIDRAIATLGANLADLTPGHVELLHALLPARDPRAATAATLST